MLKHVASTFSARSIRLYSEHRFQSILERNTVKSPFEDPSRTRVKAITSALSSLQTDRDSSHKFPAEPQNAAIARIDELAAKLALAKSEQSRKDDTVFKEVEPPRASINDTKTMKEVEPPVAGSSSDGGGSGNEESNDEEARKRRERMARNTKIGMFVVLGTATAYFAGFCVYYGRANRDQDGNLIHDEFSDAGIFAPFYRILSSIKLWKDYVVEPAREKLLPDPLQPPYVQPKYTLVIEMKNVLVAPEWTYKTGYRFIKRPALDYFLDVVGYPNFEVVIYTSESNFTGPPVVDSIDPKQRIMWKLYRDCTKYMKGVHVKDLSKLNRDLSKVIYIDFDPASFQLNPDNVLRMPKWEGDMSDTSLVDLAELLKTIHLSDVDDVRPTLQYYSSFDNPAAEFRKRAIYLAEQEEEKKRQLDNKDEGILKRYSGRLFGFRRHEYAK